MDDEYFRLVLSIRHSAPRHITKQVADKALRGLARDEHARFRSSFFKGIQEVGIKAADGQVIGRGGAYNVDLLRLSNVVTRIMKGLYFHHYGSPLPTWCEVDAWSEDGLGDVDADTIQEIRKYVSHLQQGSPVEIGKGAFKYWHSPVSGGSDCYRTIWLLVFYESTAFFGVTVGHHQ